GAAAPRDPTGLDGRPPPGQNPNTNMDSETSAEGARQAREGGSEAGAGLVPARQARSRRTQEKLLAAAERLLARRVLDSLTVADIAGEAGVSVGAFYARFEGKQALVPLLGARYAVTLERE